MSSFAIVIVLSAAVLHASWNALVKASTERLAIIGLIASGHVVLGGILAIGAPLPTPEAWAYIIGSTLVHIGYYFTLYQSYKLGDLSQVYPIARGMAPVLVALGAQVFAGESLSLSGWLGVLGVSGGIFLLSGSVFTGKAPPKVVVSAMATGLMIASYSLIDGLGVRASGLGRSYIAWLFIAEVFVALAVGIHFARTGKAIAGKTLQTGLLGGLISASAYALVIYAKSFSPLAMVSTLRETSVVFAVLIGMVVLKERPWKQRLIASGIVATGVILLTVGNA